MDTVGQSMEPRVDQVLKRISTGRLDDLESLLASTVATTATTATAATTGARNMKLVLLRHSSITKP